MTDSPQGEPLFFTQHMETSAVHISLKAEEIFHIGAFPVTNSLLLSFLVLVVLSAVALLTRKKYALVPGPVQNMMEAAVEGILSLMDGVLGDRHKSERYLPLIGTIFIFILFSNWFGLLPGVGSFVVHEAGGETAPLLRAPSADLNFTLALAIIAVLAVNLFGAVAIGFGKHMKKFINFKGPIDFFIGILELVSEIAKMVSFSFRLFGNVFAGEVLLTIIAFLVPYLIPLPFLFMEIFVGFIQAFIFTMLSIVFVGIATSDHEAH